MQPALLLFAVLAARSSSLQTNTQSQLSSFHTASSNSTERIAELEREGRWWAQVGDRVFHAGAPRKSTPSDYYYALGSDAALTNEMRARRVAREGRLHIFHLPKGPAELSVPRRGERRSAMSSLIQLGHGVAVPVTFPEYLARQDYHYPLSNDAEALERDVVSKLTSGNLMQHLRDLIGSSETRSYSNAQASLAAEELLRQKFEAMGLTTCVHEFSRGSSKFANVIGYLPGSSPALTSTVTVGAHYDSRPFTGPAPGADDNGSGVASLLALAQAYMEAKLQPESTIYFVGFGGEEPGLVGSDEFANELAGSAEGLPEKCRPASSASFLRSQNNAVHKAIIMDEVGWVSKAVAHKTVNLESYDTSDEMMQHLVNSNEMHNGKALAVIHNSQPFGSDHMSFLDRGMESVLTINADDEGYPHYHSATDTIENIDGDYAAMIARMNLGALVRISGVRQ